METAKTTEIIEQEPKNIESELESKLNLANTDEDSNSKVVSDSTSEIDAKQKKKLDKLVDNILKKTNSQSNSIEDKYYALIQKFVQEQEQTKKLQLSNKEFEKTIANLNKQRDLAQNDFTKALLAKDRLEGVCRELQKHNKLIKEENLMRIKEEEDKRKEITSKFQVAIDEINKQVAENSEKNNALMQENGQLSVKLKGLLEQYEVREQHIEKVLKHKDLEIQLADAKFQQSELKFKELAERSISEQKIFEKHSNELIKKCEFHQESEKQLRSQLSTYTEKYEEFQNTLKKSNQVFESFKAEMEKMSKKIKKLEHETTQWKSKYESCEKTLQNVIKQKDDLEDKTKKLQTKYDTMEKISRALQTERNMLKEKLKNYETNDQSVSEEAKPQEQTPKTETSSNSEEKPAEQIETNSNSEDKPVEKTETSPNSEDKPVEKAVQEQEAASNEQTKEVKQETENQTIDEPKPAE